MSRRPSAQDVPVHGMPPPPRYPEGAVRGLLASDLVTPQTRAVLLARLDAPPAAAPRALDESTFAILGAVCARLIPQPERAEPIDLAGAVDDRLARGDGKGWRFAAMPPDAEAYRLGLRGVDECARATFGVGFVALDDARRDEVLHLVQGGQPLGANWARVPADRFFEELLAEVVECYYSHPLAQEEIGYVGFADARGWQALGLDALAPHEPRALDDGAGRAPDPATDAALVAPSRRP